MVPNVNTVYLIGLAILRGYAIANSRPFLQGILVVLFLLYTMGQLVQLAFTLPCSGALWRYTAAYDTNIAQAVILPIMEGITLVILLLHIRKELREVRQDPDHPVSFMDICRRQGIVTFGTLFIASIIQGAIFAIPASPPVS